MRNVHFSKAALEPWAILEGNLVVIEEIVTRHFAGEKLSPEEVQMRIHGAKRPAERMISRVDGVTVEAAMPGQQPGRGPVPPMAPEEKCVAVLPLFGTIFPRANLFTDVSGATSTEMFCKRFCELVEDPNVAAIVIDVDSPGGQVPGVEELSDEIFEARGIKPVVVVANYLMASAAYWIGSAADKIVVSPSASVGSIGVYMMHEDVSKALEMEGVKVSLISAGKYKVEGNGYEPLSDETRAALQERVDGVYAKFTGAVARNRGVSVETVMGGFGQGRCVNADEAVAQGMADEVGTLEDVIEDLLDGLLGVPEEDDGMDAKRGANSSQLTARKGARAEMVVPPGYASDEFGMNVPEANARESASAAEKLRNYLDVFGKGV